MRTLVNPILLNSANFLSDPEKGFGHFFAIYNLKVRVDFMKPILLNATNFLAIQSNFFDTYCLFNHLRKNEVISDGPTD